MWYDVIGRNKEIWVVGGMFKIKECQNIITLTKKKTWADGRYQDTGIYISHESLSNLTQTHMIFVNHSMHNKSIPFISSIEKGKRGESN